jgi:hypothetical protein
MTHGAVTHGGLPHGLAGVMPLGFQLHPVVMRERT